LFTTHGVPHDAALIASFAGRPGREVIAEHLHSFAGRGLEEVYREATADLVLPGLSTVDWPVS
jgi:sugar-phosphatase